MLILLSTLVLVLILATIGPIELRPETGLPPALERFLAFVLVGAVWKLAFPKTGIAGCMVPIIGIACLELLQTLTNDRHGQMIDFIWKAGGALLGMALAKTKDPIAEAEH